MNCLTLLLLSLTATASQSIDPRRYQASDSFLPDKAPLWLNPVEEDGWTLSHNAIRGELDVMTQVLESIGRRPIQTWEATSLQAWFEGHIEHLHDHHANEDKAFTPYMATRIKMPSKLTTDHVPLVKLLEKLNNRVSRLHEGAVLTTLRRDWARYAALMKPHLLEEERVSLPLLRAYFTPAEVGKLVESILSGAPPRSLGSFFYFMGGTREACAKFMANEGIPFFVWYIAFKGHVEVYQETMVKHIVALLSGVPPHPARDPSTATFVLTALVLAASVLAYRRRHAYQAALWTRHTTYSASATELSTLSPRTFARKVGCPSTPKMQGGFKAAWPKPVRGA